VPDCDWECDTDDGYSKSSDGKSCIKNPDPRKADCTWLPDSNIYVWVNSKFTQTYDWTNWTPASIPPVLTTDSSKECSYKCDTSDSKKKTIGMWSACCDTSQCKWWEGWTQVRECMNGMCQECSNIGGACTRRTYWHEKCYVSTWTCVAKPEFNGAGECQAETDGVEVNCSEVSRFW
jgi:hypothetical protein